MDPISIGLMVGAAAGAGALIKRRHNQRQSARQAHAGHRLASQNQDLSNQLADAQMQAQQAQAQLAALQQQPQQPTQFGGPPSMGAAPMGGFDGCFGGSPYPGFPPQPTANPYPTYQPGPACAPYPPPQPNPPMPYAQPDFHAASLPVAQPQFPRYQAAPTPFQPPMVDPLSQTYLPGAGAQISSQVASQLASQIASQPLQPGPAPAYNFQTPDPTPALAQTYMPGQALNAHPQALLSSSSASPFMQTYLPGQQSTPSQALNALPQDPLSSSSASPFMQTYVLGQQPAPGLSPAVTNYQGSTLLQHQQQNQLLAAYQPGPSPSPLMATQSPSPAQPARVATPATVDRVRPAAVQATPGTMEGRAVEPPTTVTPAAGPPVTVPPGGVGDQDIHQDQACGRCGGPLVRLWSAPANNADGRFQCGLCNGQYLYSQGADRCFFCGWAACMTCRAGQSETMTKVMATRAAPGAEGLATVTRM